MVKPTLLDEKPPLRMLLMLDNLARYKTPVLVCWLFEHGIMPLYTQVEVPIATDTVLPLTPVGESVWGVWNRGFTFLRQVRLSARASVSPTTGWHEGSERYRRRGGATL